MSWKTILSPSSLTLIALCLLFRIVTLGMPALIDTTEGRYGAIAKEMALSGNWITPKIQLKTELVPYLGKPPLYFWLAAASIHTFGTSEFSARLPSFICALITTFMVWAFARRYLTPQVASLSVLILLSSAFFYFLAGAAVIDMVLTACTTTAMISFAHATFDESTKKRLWGLLFFGSLGLGFLTKGPVAIVLVAMPLFLYLAISRSWRTLIRLPWISGGILFFIITVPWFILAERETPGFIHYFFVNENLLRFLTKNYQDRYGMGHVYPYGSVWGALFVACLPWVLVLPFYFYARRGESAWRSILRNREFLYVLLFGLTPGVFFTFARQFSPLYVLPGLPGLALAGSALISLIGAPPAFLTRVERIAFGVVAIFTLSIGLLSGYISKTRSTRLVVDSILVRHQGETPVIGFIFGSFGNPFSPWFYNDRGETNRYLVREFDLEHLATAPSIIVLPARGIDDLEKKLFEFSYKVTWRDGKWAWAEKAS